VLFGKPRALRSRGLKTSLFLVCGVQTARSKITQQDGVDGLPPGEGAFLICSFRIVDNYILQGRYEEAQRLFNRLLSRCNDVG
jgi:hypothetical protein